MFPRKKCFRYRGFCWFYLCLVEDLNWVESFIHYHSHIALLLLTQVCGPFLVDKVLNEIFGQTLVLTKTKISTGKTQTVWKQFCQNQGLAKNFGFFFQHFPLNLCFYPTTTASPSGIWIRFIVNKKWIDLSYPNRLATMASDNSEVCFVFMIFQRWKPFGSTVLL